MQVINLEVGMVVHVIGCDVDKMSICNSIKSTFPSCLLINKTLELSNAKSDLLVIYEKYVNDIYMKTLAENNGYNLIAIVLDDTIVNEKLYKKVIKVKSIKHISFNLIDNSKVLMLSNDDYRNYGIIGDVHGCIDELKMLVDLTTRKHGISKFILNGDFIDKSTKEDIFKTVEYVYDNVKEGNFSIIKGNHESFVYGYLVGTHKANDSYLLECFNTITCFDNSSRANEVKRKFIELMEDYAYDFAVIKNDIDTYYISHSLCEKKHLGKLGTTNLKNMRNFRMIREQSVQDNIRHIINEDLGSNVYHVFGHVMIDKNHNVKNKHIAIDQGCVAGGYLTCMYFPEYKYSFEHIKSLTCTNKKFDYL